MSENRSKYFDNCLKVVKNGYIEYAPDLISNIQTSLKSGKQLNDSQREYLIECFSYILDDEKRDANKGFYLKKKTKGAPKKVY